MCRTLRTDSKYCPESHSIPALLSAALLTITTDDSQPPESTIVIDGPKDLAPPSSLAPELHVLLGERLKKLKTQESAAAALSENYDILIRATCKHGSDEGQRFLAAYHRFLLDNVDREDSLAASTCAKAFLDSYTPRSQTVQGTAPVAAREVGTRAVESFPFAEYVKKGIDLHRVESYLRALKDSMVDAKYTKEERSTMAGALCVDYEDYKHLHEQIVLSIKQTQTSYDHAQALAREKTA